MIRTKLTTRFEITEAFGQNDFITVVMEVESKQQRVRRQAGMGLGGEEACLKNKTPEECTQKL